MKKYIPRKYVREDIELNFEEFYFWQISVYYWEISEDILRDEYKNKVYFGDFRWNIEQRKGTWCEICLGNFDCSYNKLTSLECAPRFVWNDFDCSNNNLTSLEWAPRFVWNDFDCSYNKLTDVQWWDPQVVLNYFLYHNNPAWRF